MILYKKLRLTGATGTKISAQPLIDALDKALDN
jgi:hypothetical protein